MEWVQVIAIILTTGAMLGASFRFMWARIDKKFESINERFKEVNERFREIKNENNERFSRLDDHVKTNNERISGMETILRSLDSRISRFEGKDEERFRNQLQVLVRKNKKTEEEG